MLRVAIAISAAGGAFWASRDESGAFRGVTVDLAHALAADLGRQLQLLAYPNSNEITEDAARGAWDVTFIPMDDARAQKLDFGPVYNASESTWLVRPGLALETQRDVDAPGVRPIAVANTTTGRAAAAFLKRTQLRGYATMPEIMDALRSAQGDAFAMSRDGLERLSRDLPGSRVLPGRFFEAKTAAAVPRGRSDMLETVTAFLRRTAQDGRLRAILDANDMRDAEIPAELAQAF
jgi:polar amino acid transport system substrate-binding protein